VNCENIEAKIEKEEKKEDELKKIILKGNVPVDQYF
jgi:hypothetical protein